MNIILFEKDELDRKISIHDPRIWHIRKILNCQEFDKFDIGIINGLKGQGWIQEQDAKSVKLGYDLNDGIYESLYPVTLLIGHPRPQSLKKIFRETTALGVSQIIVAGTDMGEKSYFSSKLWKKDKYRKYLIEGAQQAHSTLLPKVERFPDLEKSIENIDNEILIALDNAQAEEQLTRLNLNSNSQPVLAIGSERGWSDRERKILMHNGFELFKLGKRILRTETAAVAGTTLILENLQIL